MGVSRLPLTTSNHWWDNKLHNHQLQFKDLHLTNQTPNSVEEYVVLSPLQFNLNNKVCSCKLAQVTVHTSMFVWSICMSTCACSCTRTHTHTHTHFWYTPVHPCEAHVRQCTDCCSMQFQGRGWYRLQKNCCGRIREVTRDDIQNRVVRVEESTLGKAMQWPSQLHHFQSLVQSFA